MNGIFFHEILSNESLHAARNSGTYTDIRSLPEGSHRVKKNQFCYRRTYLKFIMHEEYLTFQTTCQNYLEC